MSDQIRDFEARIGRINRAYNGGRVTYVQRADGLLVPRSRSRLRFHFPWRAMLAGFVAVVVVKGFLLYYLGADGYNARLELMLENSRYSELAATILAPDPVSSWAAMRMIDAELVLRSL
ncbi:hypothetical protein HKCCE2091_10310 [Rhodobacterales bacterium HKCCE2091]|nr:hypothetical protein [Rhodobacterales bacterium HKCCE2091]